MGKLVSIIIPCYNSISTIDDTINSVFSQTHSEWEIIIVDDCSTDGTFEYLQDKKDDRLRLFRTTSNFGGPAKARNIGLLNSNGKYICFLDSDDIWLNNKLEVQISEMEKKSANFSCTEGLTVDHELKIIGSLTSKVNICSLDEIIKRDFVITSSVMFEKNIFIDHIFECDPILTQCAEDLSLWLQIFSNNRFCGIIIKKKLMKYRVLSNSLTSRNDLFQRLFIRDYCIYKNLISLGLFNKLFQYSLWSLIQKIKYRVIIHVKGCWK